MPPQSTAIPNWKEVVDRQRQAAVAPPQRRVRPTVRQRVLGWVRANPLLLGLLLVATVLQIGWFVYYFQFGDTIIYGDGITKLNNARRVFDNPVANVSLAQLGTIWLPMQSLLATTLIWIDPLYYSGLAGSVYSMAAFVGTVAVVFLIVRQLWHNQWAAAIGALVVIFNLNAIYLGTTPMTESLIIFIQALMVWSLMQVDRQPRAMTPLFLCAGVFGFAALVRYEVWFAMLLAFPLLGLILWVHGVRWGEWAAKMITVGLVPGFVAFFWIVGWQWPLTGNPLHFASSEYSARIIDVIAANNLDAIGNVGVSIREYVAAVRWNIADLPLLVAVLGFFLYLYRLARRREKHLGPLMTLAIPAFFLFSLYMGQNAIVIRLGTLDSVNIRYGSTIIFVIGIFAGYLAGWVLSGRGRVTRVVGMAAAGAMAIGIVGVGINTMQTPREIALFKDFAVQRSVDSDEISAWLHNNYDGGRILAESFGRNTGVQFQSQIPLKEYISESSFVLWGQANRDPVSTTRWVLVRNNDRLDKSVAQTPHFNASYDVAFENAFGRVYLRRPDARPLPAEGLPQRSPTAPAADG